MIPAPKLDDRTYADLLAEAMRLIPRYCPEWTDHNPSDPGITILELTAWMTELILYRLNRVPEKSYLAFLDLIGIKLRAQQPARSLITFQLVEGAERQVIKEGTQVATQQAAEDDTIVFETEKELVVVGAPLDRCFSHEHDRYSDNSLLLDGAKSEGFQVFGGAVRMDRFLLLADSRFKALSRSSLLRLQVTCPDHGGRDLSRLLEWEYWNGHRWRNLEMMPVEVERGEVVFAGQDDMKTRTENGIEGFFIRGRLVEVPATPQETEIDTVKAVIETCADGIVADQALANLDGGVFLALDLGKNSYPLGTAPKMDQCFYLASRELLSQPDAEARIEIQLSDRADFPEPKGSESLIVSWEYFDGKKWRILGKSTPQGSQTGGSQDLGFVDSTHAFTRSGAIAFRVPHDLRPGAVNGEDNFWVRARIETGDYGMAGRYLLEGDKWIWCEERPLRPPAFKSVTLRYRADLDRIQQVLSYNDFCYRDHSKEASVAYSPFQPFSAVPDEEAALYLGWNGTLPNDPISLYFLIADSPVLAEDERSGAEAAQRIVWEHFDGTIWTELVVIDGTRNFTQSGLVEFVGPETQRKSVRFAEERTWIRARLEMGGYVKPPRLRRILTNTVEAVNAVTMRDEVLGSSDGTPIQTFGLAHGPLLDGEIVEVHERDRPPAEEVEDLGDGAVRLAGEAEESGFWVRWRAVESCFDSGPRARHYVADRTTGEIQFGDGSRGMMPPAGRNNVVARSYRVGGGARGNVNAMTLTQLTRAIAYIEKCHNALPAAGGADAESVEEAKARAPLTLKSRDRAVTTEDFESLALLSSTAVARARCLSSQERAGEVQVVIVPNPGYRRGDERTLDLADKLSPAPELLRLVKNFLDARRLVGTVVEVIEPGYLEISLKVTVVRRTVGQSDRMKREIEERTRRHLHPLVGGRDGKGWPFGRAVYKTDLVHLLEDVPGVEGIDSIAIFDEDRRLEVENVRLHPYELIHLVNVSVVERVRAEIL